MASPAAGAPLDRRQFLQAAAAGTTALPVFPALPLLPPPAQDPAIKISHHVPADKRLDPARLQALQARGERKVYRGAELAQLAMPIGGIAAGQLYLTGEGRFAEWNLTQEHRNSGYGATSYQARELRSDALQQFVITARWPDGREVSRNLDRADFPELEFVGEYPLAFVRYAAADFPLEVTLEAFSPFIPLHADDSALPATVLRYQVRNRDSQPLSFLLRVRVESLVGRASRADGLDLVRDVGRGEEPESGALWLRFGAREADGPAPEAPLVLADFEHGYGDWTASGEAFGAAPAAGTLPRQQPVTGFLGAGLVNTFRDGDRTQGSLRSPTFVLARPYLNFLLGGGDHPGETCVNLLVDGAVVASASGRNEETLRWHSFDLRARQGQTARLEIVDRHSGAWGHVNVDQIQLESRPRRGGSEPWAARRDRGGMALGIVPGPELEAGPDAEAWAFEYSAEETRGDEALWGGVAWSAQDVPPGGQGEASVLLAWHFPHRPDGARYAARFADVDAVIAYLARRLPELRAQTQLWHDTWYDSTLPYWLRDRLHAPVANLATGLTEWRADGRFWAWEGVGCCEGTCSHVWNYAHALARLFPELERSVRARQDFGAAFHPDGLVGFRGNDWYAADGQCGTILKAYREHLCSADEGFLRRHWPKIKLALEYAIARDGAEPDGLIEDSQHNTYDINFEGANTFVGALYLAALRAGHEMAKRVGDVAFAGRCRELAAAGARASMQRLFNGEYFVQEVDLQRHPQWQYGPGCLADQMFGQGWAHQLGLGHLYPPEAVRAALAAVWKYNWAPDVGPQNAAHPPERWFARPGEAGLFTCTWPKSEYLAQGVRYREEVWTGIEYQVAGHMIWEGMLEPALAVLRGVHERYDGRKHNPWNEVECGDHYARALASWGVFTALCGFEYDGPAGRIAFAPRLRPDDFRAAFTAAEGWGSFSLQQRPTGVAASLRLAYGRLYLTRFEVAAAVASPPRGMVTLDGRAAPARLEADAGRVRAHFEPGLHLTAGQSLRLELLG